MSTKLRGHLRSNVVGYVAVFLALSGTAVATHPGGDNTIDSGDIINAEVKTADLNTSAVTNVKIASNAVNSDKISNETVTGDDIKNATVRGGDLKNETVEGIDVLNDSLTGADIAEPSLDLGTFFAADSTAFGACADDDENTDVCALTTVTLEQPGQLLLNGTGNWYTFSLDDSLGPGAGTDDTTLVHGVCDLRVDGTTIGGAQDMGEVSGDAPTANHPAPESGTMALTALSGALAAGPHTVAVDCLEVDGDIDWGSINLTAVRADN